MPTVPSLTMKRLTVMMKLDLILLWLLRQTLSILFFFDLTRLSIDPDPDSDFDSVMVLHHHVDRRTRLGPKEVRDS